MTASPSNSWRIAPFEPGRAYRVLQDFTALRDRFRAGEVLIYDSDGYSRYDGYTGYFFRQEDGEGLRIWDIADEEDLEIWTSLFAPEEDGSAPSPPEATEERH